uniref:Major facilitator superfamily (MFS) profile domain-containing protein n=1 Tax=Spongospora subterranea TaxID=70186 RepID=A0A0H5R6P2_9EUKA|eukprot:CRZ09780.1 hypothetical protein [Spongospora subterranea]
MQVYPDSIVASESYIVTSTKHVKHFSQLITTSVFYFILGVLIAMPALPIKKLLMDNLHAQPAEMAFIFSMMTIPWALKPLYGLLSDSCPIRGQRRRPYIIIGMLTNSLVWLYLAAIEETAGIAIVSTLMLFSSITLVLADVASDTFLVEKAQLESIADSGKWQSLAWSFRACGAMIGAGLAGIVLDHTEFGIGFLLNLSGLSSLVACSSAMLMYEPVVEHGQFQIDLSRRLADLIAFWKTPDIWRTSVFVAMFACSPSSGDTVFFFMRRRLGFSMDFLGVLSVMRYASSMAGAVVYRQYLRQKPYNSLLRWTITSAFIVSLSTICLVERWNTMIGFPDQLFVFGDTMIMAVCSEVAMMPIIISAARISPQGSEGIVYASIISISNLSSMVSEASGGWLTHSLGITKDDFSNLWLLILICSVSTLLPLPFVHFVPELGSIGDYGSLPKMSSDSDSESIQLTKNGTPTPSSILI